MIEVDDQIDKKCKVRISSAGAASSLSQAIGQHRATLPGSSYPS